MTNAIKWKKKKGLIPYLYIHFFHNPWDAWSSHIQDPWVSTLKPCICPQTLIIVWIWILPVPTALLFMFPVVRMKLSRFEQEAVLL